jgi:hypothetical protein
VVVRPATPLTREKLHCTLLAACAPSARLMPGSTKKREDLSMEEDEEEGDMVVMDVDFGELLKEESAMHLAGSMAVSMCNGL